MSGSLAIDHLGRTQFVGYSVDQAREWFTTAADLTTAADAIKRESITGHLYINPPLTAEQVQQRQQILSIAHAVIEAARKRALENFHSLQHSQSCEKNEAGGSVKSPQS